MMGEPRKKPSPAAALVVTGQVITGVALAAALAACGTASSGGAARQPGGAAASAARAGTGGPAAGAGGTDATGTPAAGAGAASSRGLATGGATPGPGAAPAACRSASLAVSADAGGGAAAAGSAYLPLNFVNTSGTTCTLSGYPGISAVTGTAQVGPAATFLPGAVTKVVLGPRAAAHAWLRIADPANYPADACRAVGAHALRVYPPGGATPVYLPEHVTVCRSARAPVLGVLPVQPGAASRTASP